MLAQKGKKNFLAKIFCIFITHLIKALNSLDSSRLNRRLSQNPNKGGFRELFLPKNDFKTFSVVNFPKKNFWRPGNQDMKFRLDFFSHALLHMNSL